MYCYHCGYKLNEHKIEANKSSYDLVKDMEIDSETTIEYVCPRCGHIIREGMSHEDQKALSRASHAQVQRGSNSFASGMCLNALGLILAIISVVFFLLSNKPQAGFVYNCGEFYVAVATAVMAVILLTIGMVKTINGIVTKKHYSSLLKDLNNNTFVQ